MEKGRKQKKVDQEKIDRREVLSNIGKAALAVTLLEGCAGEQGVSTLEAADSGLSGEENQGNNVENLNEEFHYYTSYLLEDNLALIEKDKFEKYDRMINIFKEYIISDKYKYEKDMVALLKRENALPHETITRPSGKKNECLTNSVLIETLDNAKYLYANGELSLNAVELGICYKEKSSYAYSERSSKTTSSSNTEFSARAESLRESRTETRNTAKSESSVCCVGNGRNQLTIDGRNIGPLADPKSFEGIFEDFLGRKETK